MLVSGCMLTSVIWAVLDRELDGSGRVIGSIVWSVVLCLLVGLALWLPWRKEAMRQPSPGAGLKDQGQDGVAAAETFLRDQLAELVPEYRVPDVDLIGLMWPADPDESPSA